MVNFLFIITRPHRNFFVNKTTFQLILCYSIAKIKIVIFRTFWKKESSELISWIFEIKLFEEKLTYTCQYQYLNISILQMFPVLFTFQCVITSLSAAFRQFIGDAFPLHTHTHAQTQTQTLIFICYGTGLRPPANIYCLF